MMKKLKNELGYFWLYYKWQFLAVLSVVLLFLYFGVSALTEKKTVLSVMLLDCHASCSQEEMEERFLEDMGFDRKTEKVEVQSSLMLSDASSGNYAMTSLSRFLTEIGSGKLDLCGMVLQDFEKYDKSGTFLDLSLILPQELLARLENYQIRTEDGRIIGLDPKGLPVLADCGCYEEEAAAVGIVYNTTRKEKTVEFLAYLAGE